MEFDNGQRFVGPLVLNERQRSVGFGLRRGGDACRVKDAFLFDGDQGAQRIDQLRCELPIRRPGVQHDEGGNHAERQERSCSAAHPEGDIP